jgi:hypothetical protein
MTQVLEYLPGKCKALSTNLSIAKRKKKRLVIQASIYNTSEMNSSTFCNSFLEGADVICLSKHFFYSFIHMCIQVCLKFT